MAAVRDCPRCLLDDLEACGLSICSSCGGCDGCGCLEDCACEFCPGPAPACPKCGRDLCGPAVLPGFAWSCWSCGFTW